MSQIALDAEALYVDLLASIRPLVRGDAVLVGIWSGGAWLAERLHRDLQLPGTYGVISSTLHRDDFGSRGMADHGQWNQEHRNGHQRSDGIHGVSSYTSSIVISANRALDVWNGLPAFERWQRTYFALPCHSNGTVRASYLRVDATTRSPRQRTSVAPASAADSKSVNGAERHIRASHSHGVLGNSCHAPAASLHSALRITMAPSVNGRSRFAHRLDETKNVAACAVTSSA